MARTSTADLLVTLLLGAVGLGGVADLVSDAPSSWYSGHVLLEVALAATSGTLAVFLWLRWRETRAELTRAEASLSVRAAERDAWRASAEEALRPLTVAVGQQFDRWQLTPAEREVALLLLQGLGHRDIAARTGRSERTVRQHAVAVYDKSGQSGRAELAGFFLHGIDAEQLLKGVPAAESP